MTDTFAPGEQSILTAAVPVEPEDPSAAATPASSTRATVGRFKEAPVCVDSVLQKEAMSTEILRQWVFATDAIFPCSTDYAKLADSAAVTTAVAVAGSGSSWSRLSMASSTGTVATTATSTPTATTSAMILSGSETNSPDPEMESNLPILIKNKNTTADRVPVSVVSVSSNNSCAGDSHALSSDETTEYFASNFYNYNKNNLKQQNGMQPPTLETTDSTNSSGILNAKVIKRTISRQGRSTQRWVSIPLIPNGSTTTNASVSPNLQLQQHQHHTSWDPMMRLVTGCVPILQCGKILFVSASRKSAWILPKGGWEQDESMEESAIRECFEEAGCLGTLGPALQAVQHETRKAKKRRLDHEQSLDQQLNSLEDIVSHDAINTTATTTAATTSSTCKPLLLDTFGGKIGETANDSTDAAAEDSTEENCGASGSASDAATKLTSLAPIVLSAESLSRIRRFSLNTRNGHQTDNETISVGSTISTTYTHVQMTLFPLYVQKIEDVWPEKGRFRKAVAIDDAIAMLENRPELQAALQEVKDRRLHIVNDGPTGNDGMNSL